MSKLREKQYELQGFSMEPPDDPDEGKTEMLSLFGKVNTNLPKTIEIEGEMQLAREIRVKNPKKNKIDLYKEYVKTCRENEIKAKSFI